MLIKVRVKSDGNVALAEAAVVGSVYGFREAGPGEPTVVVLGSSRRHPEDDSNKQAGEALAVARALQNLGAKMERRAMGLVKHNDDVRAKRQASAAQVREIEEYCLAYGIMTEGDL